MRGVVPMHLVAFLLVPLPLACSRGTLELGIAPPSSSNAATVPAFEYLGPSSDLHRAGCDDGFRSRDPEVGFGWRVVVISGDSVLIPSDQPGRLEVATPERLASWAAADRAYALHCDPGYMSKLLLATDEAIDPSLYFTALDMVERSPLKTSISLLVVDDGAAPSGGLYDSFRGAGDLVAPNDEARTASLYMASIDQGWAVLPASSGDTKVLELEEAVREVETRKPSLVTVLARPGGEWQRVVSAVDALHGKGIGSWISPSMGDPVADVPRGDTRKELVRELRPVHEIHVLQLHRPGVDSPFIGIQRVEGPGAH